MHSKTLPTIFALFVVAATACAAPQISGDTQVKPGGFAELRLSVPNDAVIWDVSPEPIQASEISGTLVFTGVPGTTYQARAIIITLEAGKLKIDRVKYTVVFLSGPGPGPGPGPVPPAPPGPTPPAPISPFAKRLQEAAIADGWDKGKLSAVAAAALKAADDFQGGRQARKLYVAVKESLASCPPLKRNLAAIIDEQVTETLNALLKDPDATVDAATAKQMGDMFRALSVALNEAAR